VSLWVKLHTNFYSHRKTLRLRAAIGDDAFWVPPRLWAYAAENQPDGDFSDYTDEEIASLIGYTKDAPSMLQALLRAEFMDKDRRIHDWADYNGFHKAFKARAANAARVRWEKERTKEDQMSKEEIEEMKQALLQACSKHLNEMFHRNPKQQWSYAEQSQLVDILRRPECQQELQEIAAFQKREPRYFPQSLDRLLTSWTATLDRSRKPKTTNGQDHHAERASREYQQVIKAKRL
jgi:hypothetical protein